MSNIKLIVATHRKATMPSDDNLYIPVHVGAIGKESLGYQRDDEGENISEMNPFYSELTGVYWAWKNLDYDYLGLVHYRRYFAPKPIKYKETTLIDEVVLSRSQIEKFLEEYDVIVPKKRKYYIQTLYSHYADTHEASHLDETRKIISGLCPDYLKDYDHVMKQRSGYMFNMFIMNRELTNSYLTWLFPILDELYRRLDISNYSAFDARLFGRVSELLFNVWLHHQDLKIKEVPFIYFDNVNFVKKGVAFLQAKFMGKKYNASF